MRPNSLSVVSSAIILYIRAIKAALHHHDTNSAAQLARYGMVWYGMVWYYYYNCHDSKSNS